MKYIEAIIASGLFREISIDDYEEAYSQLVISARRYKKNGTIFLEGDEVKGLSIVKSGSVRSEKTYPDGERHIVEIFEEGSVFALEIAASRKKTTTTEFISNEESLIVFVSMRSILECKFAGKMGSVVTQMLADNNIRMGHKVEILAERGLRDRILVYLEVLQAKSRTDVITLRMNREQMAAFLCVNRSALSNELSKMQQDGVIEMKGRKIWLKK